MMNSGLNMPEGRKVKWSVESSKKVTSIKKYLYEEWSEAEVKYFLNRLQHFEKLVAKYPEIYPASRKFPHLRKAFITKHQSAIYEIDHKVIRVYTIIDHRQKY